MHNDLPEYFSTMKHTLPTVCRRYEIRAPVFHLPVIRHTFAERSIRFCLINLLNKDTRSSMIMERVDTDKIGCKIANKISQNKLYLGQTKLTLIYTSMCSRQK